MFTLFILCALEWMWQSRKFFQVFYIRLETHHWYKSTKYTNHLACSVRCVRFALFSGILRH